MATFHVEDIILALKYVFALRFTNEKHRVKSTLEFFMGDYGKIYRAWTDPNTSLLRSLLMKFKRIRLLNLNSTTLDEWTRNSLRKYILCGDEATNGKATLPFVCVCVLGVVGRGLNLIHIDCLNCISSSEDYSMVLVLRFAFTKLGVPRQFNAVYFLYM